MVGRLSCGLVILTLTACASGEDVTQSSGFGGSLPATMPASASASATQGMSSTSEPTGSGSGSTTEMIRPDMGVDSSSGGPDPTTGPVSTTTTATTDPSGTGTTTTTGPMIMCGDGEIEGMEECEGADLAGETCMTLGFTGGTLSCAANCVFDKSQCLSESCGDGTKNGGEECDCGQQGSPCTPAQLGNTACSNLVAPANGNYHGGTLTCGSPQSCVFNKSACTYCGDGVRNGPEACEGGDLGGQTCAGLGFNGGGNLSCNANCTHNTGGCKNIVCGNGVCDPGEDSCGCPGDCPDDPNSCSSCECGGNGGNCYCDDSCLIFLDCCGNGPC